MSSIEDQSSIEDEGTLDNQSVKCSSQTEIEINFTVKVNSNYNDQINNIKNSFENRKALSESLTGEGKLFPRGPTCMFNGKVVPCFTRWRESGDVPSSI